ncbi:hypothetical protein JOF34_001432 [Microbacterium amylolyticum]|uniref:Htaa protein n=1 Tax=Microbacterium amylolyticum TaxID=936337 RepID=A0ABS4ZK70_9MICO|nr:hypothetical protein [Microbacterium amylolyticum]
MNARRRISAVVIGIIVAFATVVPLAPATAKVVVGIDGQWISSSGANFSIDDGESAFCTGCSAYKRETVVVNGPTHYSFRHVRDLTHVWGKTDGYTWSTTTTTSATLSADIGVSAKSIAGDIGVSSSKTKSYGVNFKVKADARKFSKLALYSDFKRYYVKSRTTNMGVTGKWKYAYIYAPTNDQYLHPRYK